MSSCNCEWLGDCACELTPDLVPVSTPAKACKVQLKKQEGRSALAKESATAVEPSFEVEGEIL